MVTAALVKELREKTGAGMMDCKKVLTETDGDLEKAAELLREKGITKAAKKAALDCTKKLETKNAEQLEEMVAGGAEKTDNVDKAAFKEAAQSVYDKFLSNNEQGAKYYEAITALTAK